MGLFGWREPRVCWVRGATDDPCGGIATVEIQGVPFCETCAREYEEYAAIGALTDPLSGGDPGGLRDVSLTESLKKMRRARGSNAAYRGAPRRGQKI